MRKKMMLLALVVVSAAAFALPAGASAAELHLTNVTSFTGTFGAMSLSVVDEPVITCGGIEHQSHVTGTMNPGGTTGSIDIDFTDCHMPIFGATVKCRTTGSPVDNTVQMSGTFHLITVSEKPGILMTPPATAINCGGSILNMAGSFIGTFTSPACGVAANNMTVKFAAAGATQEHKTYTGVSYNWTLQTGTGTIREVGLVTETSIASATAGTLDCT